jgi:hypothetical protein
VNAPRRPFNDAEHGTASSAFIAAMPTAQSTFYISEWISESENRGFPNVIAVQATAYATYRGDLIGEGEAHVMSLYLAVTDELRVTGHLACEQIAGTLDGRSGTFVIQHRGLRSEGSSDKRTGLVLPRSGTRELKGISGEVVINRSPDGLHTMELVYEFESLFPWRNPGDR